MIAPARGQVVPARGGRHCCSVRRSGSSGVVCSTDRFGSSDGRRRPERVAGDPRRGHRRRGLSRGRSRSIVPWVRYRHARSNAPPSARPRDRAVRSLDHRLPRGDEDRARTDQPQGSASEHPHRLTDEAARPAGRQWPHDECEPRRQAEHHRCRRRGSRCVRLPLVQPAASRRRFQRRASRSLRVTPVRCEVVAPVAWGRPS